MKLICTICFVMVMFLWLLSLLGAVSIASAYFGWFACLFLGISIFVPGNITIT